MRPSANSCPLTGEWLSWLRSYVAREDVRLGRPGPVCPCVSAVLRTDSMRLVTLAPNPSELASVVESYGRAFLEDCKEMEGSARQLYCIVMLFDPACLASAGALAAVHHQLKPWFIARGMMLGEFFPGNAKASVHSAEVAPMDCPVHAFVIRVSSSHDLLFVEGDLTYTPEQRRTMARHISEYSRGF